MLNPAPFEAVPRIGPKTHSKFSTSNVLFWIGLSFLTVFGLGLRLWNLDAASLWADELDSLMQSAHISEIWPNRGNGVLYFVSLALWREVFGSSPWAIRVLSVAISAVGLYAVVAVAYAGSENSSMYKNAGAKAVMRALLLACILPILVWHARDARMYPLWGFGFLLAWYGVLQFGRRGATPSSICLYSAGNLIGILSHNYHLFHAVGFAAAAWALARERSTNDNEALRAWARMHLLAFVALAACVARLFWINPDFVSYLWTWSRSESGFRPVQSLGEIVFYTSAVVKLDMPIVSGLCVAAVMALALAALWNDPGRARGWKIALLCVLIIPFLGIHLLPIRDYARLFFPTALAIVVTVAWAMGTPAWARLPIAARGAAMGALMLGIAPSLWTAVTTDIEPWNQACRYLYNYDSTTTLVVTENRSPFPPLSQCALEHKWIHHWGNSDTRTKTDDAVANYTDVLLFRSAPWIPNSNSLQPVLEARLDGGNEFALGPYLTARHFQKPASKLNNSQREVSK